MPDARAHAKPDGAGPLRFLIPTETAGRLIGRRGSRIHELQVRTGTRVQLIDRGEEKLVEVTGARASVDEAVALMMGDLVHVQRPSMAGLLSVAVLIPEALVEWTSGGASGDSPLAVGDLFVSVLGSWDTYVERQVALRGSIGSICQAFRLFNLQRQRHARWMSTGVHELPWELCDLHEDGDPVDGFISTENFRLGLQEGTASLFTGDAPHSSLLSQIQEDSGSAIRVQPGPDLNGQPWVEIAGSFGAKLRALLEVSSLLMILSRTGEADDSAGLLEVLLPAAGPSSLTCAEARELAAAHAPRSSAEMAGDRVVVGLRGRRIECCAAAIALGRAAERRAAAHEHTYGPPPLLIDYLARWFGRDMKQWPAGAVVSGTAEDKKRKCPALPVAQIAGRGTHQEGGAASKPAATAGDARNTGVASVAGTGAESPAPAGGVEEPGQVPKDRRKVSGAKRRRRIRLSNPFSGEGELMVPELAGNDFGGSEWFPMLPASIAATANTSSSTAVEASPQADAMSLMAKASAAGFLAGYSDGDSDSEDGRLALDELVRAQDPACGGESEGEQPAGAADGTEQTQESDGEARVEGAAAADSTLAGPASPAAEDRSSEAQDGASLGDPFDASAVVGAEWQTLPYSDSPGHAALQEHLPLRSLVQQPVLKGSFPLRALAPAELLLEGHAEGDTLELSARATLDLLDKRDPLLERKQALLMRLELM